MRRRLEAHPGEERLLIYLVVAILLFFVARIPNLLISSAGQATSEVSGSAIFVTNLVASFFFAPLLFYGVASVSRIMSKVFGGSGNGYSSRLALFWTLLVISPLSLLSTILQSAIPVLWLSTALPIVMFLLFAFVWGACLSVAEGFKSPYLTTLAIIMTVFCVTIAFRVFIF
ncbi:MAG: YIP1 family protein [Rhodobacteraceae bacterium]|nr:YIP1 family protein [Paracoccaceae bacterium]